ncbi:hypothetical protein [Lentzea sp. NPDC004782]|uniref:hypothetical protein n=1 Tax=Lentzea sp. NPDC004782 TaxID=3154458 RepID=UPI0033A22670
MYLRALVAGAALVGTALVATAAGPPAQAADLGPAAVTCGNANWPHHDFDDGSGTVTKSGGAPAHTGPYGDCKVVGSVPEKAKVSYDCYVTNSYGNRWTWVRDQNGASIGWIYGRYLSGGGSSVPC